MSNTCLDDAFIPVDDSSEDENTPSSVVLRTNTDSTSPEPAHVPKVPLRKGTSRKLTKDELLIENLERACYFVLYARSY